MNNDKSTTSQGVCIHYFGPEDKAHQLGRKLSLPVVHDTSSYDFFLNFTNSRLCLTAQGYPSTQQKTVYAEFVMGAAGYRRRLQRKEILLKAIGFSKNTPLTILDVTGGLGKDSFLMATHGCKVHILERNPIVAALLDDGLQRAKENRDTCEIAQRIELSVINSIDFLKNTDATKKYDVVYLDPMFPERNKSALVKKEMQLLQQLIGTENDTEELFTAALALEPQRVVVKRPKNASPLPGPAPSHSLSGKTVRFDVYLTVQKK